MEWEPEHEVDAAQAQRLVAAQWPDLAGLPVTALATGWDNTVHLLGDGHVLRFPRRAQALDGWEREARLLPLLAPHLPLPVPVPERLGTPDDGYPWPFSLSRLLPGTELARSGLPDTDRTPAAQSLGGFLRALHDPGLAGALGAGLPVDPMRRADPARRLDRSQAWFARLASAGLWSPDAAVRALEAEARRLPPPPGAPVLVHGDLHVRHLLLDDGTATAVLDWGDVCLADPAVDLSLAYAGFRGASRAALLAAYGPVDREREVRARVLALSLCAALADQASATGDAVLLAEALAGLARAVDD